MRVDHLFEFAFEIVDRDGFLGIQDPLGGDRSNVDDVGYPWMVIGGYVHVSVAWVVFGCGLAAFTLEM